MTPENIEDINNWMRDPDNLKKLSVTDQAKINLYFLEYMERIAPIVVPAMAKDSGVKFLFKF